MVTIPQQAPRRRGDGRGLPRVPAAFVPAPAAARALEGLPALVVIQAPRGFGKTTTASAWLRRPDLPDHDLVWLGLAPQTRDRAQFWADLHEAVANAGYEDPGPGMDGWERLGRTARARFRHLVVVIDAFDRVSDEGVDEELVELAQQHENLHVVLIMRNLRPAVALARASSPDAVVLQAHDLALTARQTADLAKELGVPVSATVAADVCTGLAGWPGMIRVALLTGASGDDGGFAVDHGALGAYQRIVLNDLAFEGIEAVITALAVPQSFSPELAERLVGPGELARTEDILRRMRRAGLIVGNGEGAYTYPPILREAAQEVLREDDPARYWRLNAEMAEVCRREGRAGEALEHAVRSQSPQLLAAVVRDSWAELLVADRDRLRAAVARLPQDVLGSDPVTAALRDHLLPPEVPRWFVELLQSELPVIEAGASTLAVARDDDSDPELAPVLLDLGQVLFAEGDVIGAAFACYEAVRRSTDSDAAVLREAGACLALATAMLGYLTVATAWLAWVGARPAAPPGPAEMVAAIAVPATVSLDRLEEAVLPDRPLELPDESRWLESLLVYNWANRALHLGSALEALADLEQYRDHNRRRRTSRLAQALEGAALADLCIATDQLARAREFLGAQRSDPYEHVWLRVARAQVALYSGDDDQVLALTTAGAALAPVRPRAAMALSLSRAVAAHREGQRAVAAEALHVATRVAERTGLLRPFLLVPRSDLESVASALPQTRALLERVEQATLDGPFPEPVRVQPLSGREIHVLRELASGRPVSLMARRLFVSESTVKTQVRSIYRKLDVHSRAEAVERGRLLGLVPADG